MIRLVLDANVAAKWFLPAAGEPLAANALALLHRHRDGDVSFAVPSLFWAEFANVLWKAAARGRCLPTGATVALNAVFDLGLVTVPKATIIRPALELALRLRHSVYDCVYIAAALALGCELVTADAGVARAAAPTLPIRWLGTY